MVSVAGYSPSASVFSLSVSTSIPDLTISEFISWTTNLKKNKLNNIIIKNTIHTNLKYDT
jgi:hypothetical protein